MDDEFPERPKGMHTRTYNKLRRSYERFGGQISSGCDRVIERRAVKGAFDNLADQRMDLSREQREELRELRIEVAKLGSTMAELREERVKFQFTREKDGVTDLPNFLPARRVVN